MLSSQNYCCNIDSKPHIAREKEEQMRNIIIFRPVLNRSNISAVKTQANIYYSNMSGLQNNLLKRDENKLKQISFPRQTFLDISTRVSNFGCICLTWDPAQVALMQTLILQKIKATFLSYRSRFTCRLKFHKRDR